MKKTEKKTRRQKQDDEWEWPCPYQYQKRAFCTNLRQVAEAEGLRVAKRLRRVRGKDAYGELLFLPDFPQPTEAPWTGGKDRGILMRRYACSEILVRIQLGWLRYLHPLCKEKHSPWFFECELELTATWPELPEKETIALVLDGARAGRWNTKSLPAVSSKVQAWTWDAFEAHERFHGRLSDRCPLCGTWSLEDRCTLCRLCSRCGLLSSCSKCIESGAELRIWGVKLDRRTIAKWAEKVDAEGGRVDQVAAQEVMVEAAKLAIRKEAETEEGDDDWG